MIPHQKDAVMKEHISQWKKSGLTQVAYCNEHGVKPHIFSYYKAKLDQAESSPRLSHKKLTCLSVEMKVSGESINFSILA